MRDALNWIEANRYAVAFCMVVALAAAALVVPSLERPVFEIEVQQQGPLVLLTWEDPGEYAAEFYEIQGRQFENDWETFAIVPTARMGTAVPPGVTQFRVRAWTLDGPGRWSSPTELVFFVPLPAPPPAPEPPSRRDDAMNLPWDPDLMEPGPFDGMPREALA
jgi:hypothetical protein